MAVSDAEVGCQGVGNGMGGGCSGDIDGTSGEVRCLRHVIERLRSTLVDGFLDGGPGKADGLGG